MGRATLIRSLKTAIELTKWKSLSKTRLFCTQHPDKYIIKSKYPDVQIPEVSLTEHLFNAQEKYAGRTAVISGETQEKITHGVLRDGAIRFGSALCRLGIQQGDVVAIILPNSIPFCVTFLGVSCAGAVPSTINSAFTSYEIARQLENSGASMVICSEETLEKVQEAITSCKIVRETIVVGRECDDTRSYDKLLKDDGKGIPHRTFNYPEDVAVLPYSSGTTGLPKGVMLTHRNIVANLQQACHPDVTYYRHTDENYQETLMLILPMYHIYGLACGVFASLYHGSRIVTFQTFDQKLYAKLYKKYQATMAYTVPPLLSFMVNSDLVTKETLGHTHTVFCAAAPVGKTLFTQFQAKFGTSMDVVEGFGMTELSPVSHTTPKNTKVVFGSCGQSIPNTESKIVDVNTLMSIGPKQGRGELWVRGPQVMKGYLNNPQATKDTITPEGWLRTGDICESDTHGNIYVVDRLKELIKVKGLQVPPAELEDLLRNHPKVEDVAVIGVPDARCGEIPKAFVVGKSGKSVTEEEIIQYVEDRVVEYKRLAGGVKFIDQIPKTPSGKILRKELKNA